VSVIKTGSCGLFKEIICPYCENCTKHVNTLCGQNVECFTVKQMRPLGFKLLKHFDFKYEIKILKVQRILQERVVQFAPETELN
jgi:hypothetical protein